MQLAALRPSKATHEQRCPGHFKGLFRSGIVEEEDDLPALRHHPFFANALCLVGIGQLFRAAVLQNIRQQRFPQRILRGVVAVANGAAEEIQPALSHRHRLQRRCAVGKAHMASPVFHRILALEGGEAAAKPSVGDLLLHLSALRQPGGQDGLAGDVIGLHPGIQRAHTKALVGDHRAAPLQKGLQMRHDDGIQHGVIGEIQHLILFEFLRLGHAHIIHRVVAILQQPVHACVGVAVVHHRGGRIEAVKLAAAVLDLREQHGVKIVDDGDVRRLHFCLGEKRGILPKLSSKIAHRECHLPGAAVHAQQSGAVLLIADALRPELPVHQALCPGGQGGIQLEIHVEGGIVGLEHAQAGVYFMQKVVFIHRPEEVQDHHKVHAVVVGGHIAGAGNGGAPKIHRLGHGIVIHHIIDALLEGAAVTHMAHDGAVFIVFADGLVHKPQVIVEALAALEFLKFVNIPVAVGHHGQSDGLKAVLGGAVKGIQRLHSSKLFF